MSENAISISNLEYFYRHQWTGRKIRALSPFSLDVQEGEAFGFLGHNGAGKTTTIKAILGLIRASAGKINIFGNSNLNSESRRLIGYLPEQPYFYDHLTVKEIVEMYASLSGISSKARNELVGSALKKLNIYDRRNSPMRSLSKGLTQRVAVAQTICHQPKLLILDEPFSGLDPIGRKEIRELFSSLQKNGTTIFMSSHILNDVESLCNRVSIMVKGELKGIFDIKGKDLAASTQYEVTFQPLKSGELNNEQLCEQLGGSMLSNPNLLKLRFENRTSAELAVRKASDLGLALERFENSHISLEELFVTLTNESKH